MKKKEEKEVQEYKLKNGEVRYRFRYKYYDINGKRREKKESSFLTEKEATKALIQVKADVLNGSLKQVEHSQMTVSHWLDIWYETYNSSWEVTTRRQRKTAIELQMKPLLGKYKLISLDKTTYIREYINVLKQNYADSTVALFHRLFKIAINAAVEDEIIPRNRFRKVSVEIDDELENVLTASEVDLFLQAAKEHENITNYTLILLLAYTGCRKGEALGLRWKHFDLEKRTLSVEWTRDRHGCRAPKTKNSLRTIPIDQVLVDQLIAYQRWCVETKLSFGHKVDKMNDFIFISYQDGMPIAENMAHYSFRRVHKALEDQQTPVNKITPHGLRHTHATILINQGVPIQTIAKRLGNTVAVIQKVYAHSFEEFELKAVSAFGSSLAFGAVGAKSGAK